MRSYAPIPVLAFALVAGAAAEAQERSPFRGLEHGKVYGRPVTIELEAGAPATSRLMLNGESLRPGSRVDKDGDYVVELVPAEGQRPAASLLFTVDTTPPRLTFQRPAGMPSGALPQVDVDDVNPDPKALRWFLDDQPLDRTKPIPPGKHVLAATTRDLAGNTATVTESLVIGNCQPGTYRHHVRPTRTLTAAHYFPWYRGSAECPANTPWCNCFWEDKPGNPRPALGFYDSGNPTVVAAHLQQMAAHGIDVVSVAWNGNAFERTNYETRVVPAVAARSDLQMVILYDLAIRMTVLCGSSCVSNGQVNFDDQRVFDTFVQDLTLFATHPSYFRHPDYLKFQNRPVVYVYITRAIRGASARVQDAFTRVQTAARNNGFAGLYLVADHLYWGAVDYPLLQRTQARAATSFGPVDPNQGVSQDPNARPVRTWADRMAALYWNALPRLSSIGLVDLQPGIFVQYNDRGQEAPPCKTRDRALTYNLKDGTDWAHMVQVAGVNRAYVAEQVRVRINCDETYTTNSDYTSIVWVYSFNEHWEGTGLERFDPRTPPYPYGFGLEPLQILETKLP